MLLELNATKPPNLVINPSTANFTVTGETNVYVIPSNKSVQLAFVMGIVSLHFLHLVLSCQPSVYRHVQMVYRWCTDRLQPLSADDEGVPVCAGGAC